MENRAEPQSGPTQVGVFIAHPGHEVALHGFLERERPTVFVLTDGSGQLGVSRLPSTTRVLDSAGAGRGTIYGAFTDAEIYRTIVARDVEKLRVVVREIADWLVRSRARYLVTDAAEGYNPAHDVCRTVAGVAVELTRLMCRRVVPLYEYVVTGDRHPCVAEQCSLSQRRRLNDEALRRKLDAADRYTELAAEAERALARDGVEAYRVECLHLAAPRTAWTCPSGSVPYYEHHGASRVATAKYEQLIRYAEHMVPLQKDLWAMVGPWLEIPPPKAVPAPTPGEPLIRAEL